MSTPKQYAPAEWAARCELACAYRLFDQFGWHELIYNHITLRVPQEPGHFLINPFGLLYHEVRASNLVKIDIDGNIVGRSEHPVNPAGFIVHSAVHRAREDAHCVMHTHTTAGSAVACQSDGLLPLSFASFFYADRLAYHDFEGITFEAGERDRLSGNLGTKNAMVLRNHGLLTCGASVADAFAEMYHLQRACEIQLAAQSSGASLRFPPAEVSGRTARQFDQSAREAGQQNELLFGAMRRWVHRLSADICT
ncbi:MAG: aldolase [Ramlibacter sp.]|nr:aldolase [Ramlibacter sp.]